MVLHRCGICFDTFEPDTEPESVHFDYETTVGHELSYPSDLYFCHECLPALREVTDYWTSSGSSCSFCGDENYDGTRISAEFAEREGDDISASMSTPTYNLCSNCDEIFENFLTSERAEALVVPDGWRVFGPTPQHLFGIGTDRDRVYVDPAVKRTGSGVQSMSAGVPEEDSNCYAVTLVKNIGTAGEKPSEIVAFEHAGDAIEFAQLVALYASNAPTPNDFIDRDFEPEPMEEDPWRPDPIVSGEDPREVAENMLGYEAHLLDNALEEYAN
ncbi:hypothetical protein [Haloferax gibbonsii]|uniref:Uncharacterized protein n=1 Tax=Haloferax gibbonsii TaxID=35746 RepID=A0A0K1IZC9_HALGI|nr:hypothetical protein [Haloferax gibbonsii]AKU09882.1 hypothetical protein ABY42_18870 [Haloferax gibbonsii]